jgi:hypothetical protein
MGATLASTSVGPLSITPLSGIGSTRQDSLLSKPTPVYLDKQPTPCLLSPGVYQTYPWTMIVVVPEPEKYDRNFAIRISTNSPMPAVKPDMEVVPKF